MPFSELDSQYTFRITSCPTLYIFFLVERFRLPLLRLLVVLMHQVSHVLYTQHFFAQFFDRRRLDISSLFHFLLKTRWGKWVPPEARTLERTSLMHVPRCLSHFDARERAHTILYGLS